MRYKVDCEIHIGDTYEIDDATSETEADRMAYKMFIKDYGLENNLCICEFITTDIEEIEEECDND